MPGAQLSGLESRHRCSSDPSATRAGAPAPPRALGRSAFLVTCTHRRAAATPGLSVCRWGGPAETPWPGLGEGVQPSPLGSSLGSRPPWEPWRPCPPRPDPPPLLAKSIPPKPFVLLADALLSPPALGTLCRRLPAAQRGHTGDEESRWLVSSRGTGQGASTQLTTLSPPPWGPCLRPYCARRPLLLLAPRCLEPPLQPQARFSASCMQTAESTGVPETGWLEEGTQGRVGKAPPLPPTSSSSPDPAAASSTTRAPHPWMAATNIPADLPPQSWDSGISVFFVCFGFKVYLFISERERERRHRVRERELHADSAEHRARLWPQCHDPEAVT